jgi:hypothetical protein
MRFATPGSGVWSVDPAANDLSANVAIGGAPQARILFSNLPGYPDNLTRGMDGRIWLGLVKPRGAAVDKLSAHPFLRKVVMRLPKSFWPVPPNYGHVIAFDEAGKIVADLQDPSGEYPETTGGSKRPTDCTSRVCTQRASLGCRRRTLD